MNKESKKNKKQLKKQKKIVYDVHPKNAERINKSFILNFPYNYWQHKINAIGEYIVYPEKIKDDVRYKPDITLDESIVERDAEDLYEQLRCGYFHDGMTRSKIFLTNNMATTAISHTHNGIFINPNIFLKKVKLDFDKYISDLRGGVDRELVENFEKMFYFGHDGK